MSTRCQTFIKAAGEPVATIYRHCDGYPTGMGEDLWTLARKCNSAQDMVVKILTAWHFDAELEEINAKHGDTEYEYYVEFPECAYMESKPTVTVKSLHTGRTFVMEPSTGYWLQHYDELEEFEKLN